MRKKKTIKWRQKLNREVAKEQGFYDGRFKPRIVKDKKKWNSKRGSRGWRPENEKE
jgi:hypothetical protein